MTRVDDLVDAYRRAVSLPWDRTVAPAQRVWMLVYDPEDERRVRRNIGSLEQATRSADHGWHEVLLNGRFESWLASHEYADAYFRQPDLVASALPEFMDRLTEEVRAEVGAPAVGADDVVALIGAGTLFGLGEIVRTSALLDRIQDAIKGRLLVLFPGHHAGNNYRLLDAKDGWNYLATPITADGGPR